MFGLVPFENARIRTCVIKIVRFDCPAEQGSTARSAAPQGFSSCRACRTQQFMVDVAQLVESRIVIPVVAGSSPVIHPI